MAQIINSKFIDDMATPITDAPNGKSKKGRLNFLSTFLFPSNVLVVQ